MFALGGKIDHSGTRANTFSIACFCLRIDLAGFEVAKSIKIGSHLCRQWVEAGSFTNCEVGSVEGDDPRPWPFHSWTVPLL